ncbi:MAG: hypothetical protein MI861_02830, partial [Pirellulales bacterium]|nr:hypothetical protein [Pirellulales bacterium]
AVTDQAVVVSNSMIQIKKVLACAGQQAKSLGELDEYRFFRQRYRRADADESALVIISDATIRRWCGPQWRIAASRRTRARATIADVTMQHADALVSRSIEIPRSLAQPESVPQAGKLWLTSSAVRSERFGTLRFQTPIAELDIQTATEEEIQLYESWRQQYERQWRNSFDPIALKLSLRDDAVEADLSVIPLMVRSQYRWWVNWAGKARLKPSAGDEHPEAVATINIALDPQSWLAPLVNSVFNQQGQNLDWLGWIDGYVSAYLDFDEEWMQQVTENPRYESIVRSAREAPLGIFVPSKNTFLMTAFVVAARGTLERFSPNVLRWEQSEHKGITYVVANFVEDNAVARAEEMPMFYYVTTSEGLTLSLSRKVIHRAIDRHLDRKERAEEGAQEREPALATEDSAEQQVSSPGVHRPQVAARITGLGATVAATANHAGGVRRMSQLSWSNLPILNYFRHRYPDQDPFQVYQQLLGETLLEPALGQYQWNKQHLTYQSTQYGHPLAPRSGPPLSPVLAPDDLIETSLSFDNGGLRAKLKLTPAQ